MDWQHIVTAMLVTGSAAYALRALWPIVARFLRPGTAAPAGGCGGGCSGCGSAAPRPVGTPGESVIRIVRRAPAAGHRTPTASAASATPPSR